MVGRRISRLWRCAGLNVVVIDKPEEAMKHLDGVSFIGADDFDLDVVTEALGKNKEMRAAVWTADSIERPLRMAMEEPRLSNIFGRPDFRSTPRDWELLMVARRLMRPQDGGTPFAAFLNWGATGFQEHVRDTPGIDTAVAKVRRYVTEIGAATWIADMFGELTHELLMNGVYDAPADADGNPRFAHDRKQIVELPQEEASILRIASDGVLVCLQVVDPFGRLRRDHVFHGLARGLRGGEQDHSGGGAGLGMVVCHNSTVAMIYDVTPKQRTEVTAFFDLDLNRRDFRNWSKSLHFFERE